MYDANPTPPTAIVNANLVVRGEIGSKCAIDGPKGVDASAGKVHSGGDRRPKIGVGTRDERAQEPRVAALFGALSEDVRPAGADGCIMAGARVRER